MRLKQHRVIRPFALAATAAMIGMMVALAWGPGVGLAADYQDAAGNVCEGLHTPACPLWGSHFTPSAFYNVALGDEMMESLTSGSNNVALDFGALAQNTTGTNNIAIGKEALNFNKEGVDNVASGDQALFSSTGSENVALGFMAGYNLTGGGLTSPLGSANVALGFMAGFKLTGGSNNIDISNEGAPGNGEEGTTRIGTQGTQKRAFMAGIWNKSISPPNPVCLVKVNAEGQLGCKPGETGPTGPQGPTGPTGPQGQAGPAGNAAIATFASFTRVPSGNCLDYTELEGPGNESCPPTGRQPAAFDNSPVLAGPTPANGATVTNLYADTNGAVGGGDTATVAVIDNTTATTLLSCTVNSTNINHCSNTSGSGSAAAGENIMVQVTTNRGPSTRNLQWRVRFRY